MAGIARRLAAHVAAHLLGILAHSAFSPVVVAYAFMIAGSAGLVLASTQTEPSGSLAAFVERVALFNLGWLDQLWNREASFQDNALRLFGLLGLIGWMLEPVVRRIRPPRPGPDGWWAELRHGVIRLGMLTLVVSSVMFGAALTVEWAGDPPLIRRVVQGGAMAFGIGTIIFLASVPALAMTRAIHALRAPVARAILASGPSALPAGTVDGDALQPTHDPDDILEAGLEGLESRPQRP